MMNTPQFLEVNPVLPVTNMAAAIRFYIEKLGFRLLFKDPADIDLQNPNPIHPSYAVVGRDQIRLHLQSHNPDNPDDRSEPLHIRFRIDDVDGLYTEYQTSQAIVLTGFSGMPLGDTPWGTREFGLYDPDKHGLFFYRNR
jgi:catechol 2,3-dioxygenase-like lactoylglutathione lyase family enzyme